MMHADARRRGYEVVRILAPPITNWEPFCNYVGELFDKSRMDTATIAEKLGEPESYVYTALAAWREKRRTA